MLCGIIISQLHVRLFFVVFKIIEEQLNISYPLYAWTCCVIVLYSWSRNACVLCFSPPYSWKRNLVLFSLFRWVLFWIYSWLCHFLTFIIWLYMDRKWNSFEYFVNNAHCFTGLQFCGWLLLSLVWCLWLVHASVLRLNVYLLAILWHMKNLEEQMDWQFWCLMCLGEFDACTRTSGTCFNSLQSPMWYYYLYVQEHQCESYIMGALV